MIWMRPMINGQRRSGGWRGRCPVWHTGPASPHSYVDEAAQHHHRPAAAAAAGVGDGGAGDGDDGVRVMVVGKCTVVL